MAVLGLQACATAESREPSAGIDPPQSVPVAAEPTNTLNDDRFAETTVDGEGTARDELSRYSLVAAVGYTPQERQVIDAAWSRLFSNCMKDSGFDVPIEVPETVEDDPAARQLASMTFDDLDLIESEGYHWLDDVVESAPGNSGSARGLDEHGDVSDSCKSAANEQLSNGEATGTAADRVNQAQAEIVLRLETAPELIDARNRWSECMAEAGYRGLDFSNPEWILRFLSQPEATPEEIRTALTDAECRSTSNLGSAFREALAGEVQEWLVGNEGQVLEIRSRIDHEVERSLEVLED